MSTNNINSNKICFLIPIFESHYKFLKFIDNIKSNYEFSIYFISTTFIDRENLKNYLKRYKENKIYKNILHICLEDNNIIKKYIKEFNSREKGIINIKKFYGLYYIKKNLKKKFHYIAVIDSEIMFIDLNNLYYKFAKYCKNRTIICGDVSYNTKNKYKMIAKKIHKNCLNFMKNTDDVNIVNKNTKNGNLYFWFSDIPIYKASYLDDFLEYIKFNENEKEFRLLLGKMNYQTFDYIIYIYWCILKKGYKLLCMRDYNINRCWSLESASFKIYDEVKQKMNYTTNMIVGCCYLNNKEKFNNNPILIYDLGNPKADVEKHEA